MPQTSYSTTMTVAREGAIAESSDDRKIDSYEAASACKFGLLLEVSSGKVQPLSALPSDDHDAIIDGKASAATAQTFELTDLNGTTGGDAISPPQRLACVFNSHADWDATVMKIYGEAFDGSNIVEDVEIPNGGNTTLYTVNMFRRVEKVFLPAQTGTNGVLDIGTDVDDFAYDREAYPGIAVYEPMTSSYASTTEIEAAQVVSVMKRGRLWVVTESTAEVGDPVFVRGVLSGADVRGQFRAGPAANFGQLANAVFVTAAAADGLAIIELR